MNVPWRRVDTPDVKKTVDRIFDFINRELDKGGSKFSVLSRHNDGAIINKIATLLPKQVFWLVNYPSDLTSSRYAKLPWFKTWFNRSRKCCRANNRQRPIFGRSLISYLNFLAGLSYSTSEESTEINSSSDESLDSAERVPTYTVCDINEI